MGKIGVGLERIIVLSLVLHFHAIELGRSMLESRAIHFFPFS